MNWLKGLSEVFKDEEIRGLVDEIKKEVAKRVKQNGATKESAEDKPGEGAQATDTLKSDVLERSSVSGGVNLVSVEFCDEKTNRQYQSLVEKAMLFNIPLKCYQDLDSWKYVAHLMVPVESKLGADAVRFLRTGELGLVFRPDDDLRVKTEGQFVRIQMIYNPKRVATVIGTVATYVGLKYLEGAWELFLPVIGFVKRYLAASSEQQDRFWKVVLECLLKVEAEFMDDSEAAEETKNKSQESQEGDVKNEGLSLGGEEVDLSQSSEIERAAESLAEDLDGPDEPGSDVLIINNDMVPQLWRANGFEMKALGHCKMKAWELGGSLQEYFDGRMTSDHKDYDYCWLLLSAPQGSPLGDAIKTIYDKGATSHYHGNGGTVIRTPLHQPTGQPLLWEISLQIYKYKTFATVWDVLEKAKDRMEICGGMLEACGKKLYSRECKRSAMGRSAALREQHTLELLMSLYNYLFARDGENLTAQYLRKQGMSVSRLISKLKLGCMSKEIGYLTVLQCLQTYFAYYGLDVKSIERNVIEIMVDKVKVPCDSEAEAIQKIFYWVEDPRSLFKLLNY